MPNNFLFNVLAPVYERVISSPQPEALREALALRAEHRLLDAGGGTGRVSSVLGRDVETVVIADLSYEMLRQAHAKRVTEQVQTSAVSLPFSDAAFDRIMVVDALHHFPHQTQVLCELMRVLKPGGRMLIEEPDIAHWGVKLVALMETLALMDSHFLTPIEIQRQVASCGATTEIRMPNTHTAWVVVDKT
ncbi:MAG: class I SAM-dependent methyltransferase [Anaerolineae bacterium]|jgi:demethylmenaquinone methyltransferase/2-methoxy-6-polyprenyl-1,4-benzoquinol methylase|nr:class I SAM-dependent methyltransferase [Anaerolineae bacterium]